MGAEKTELDAAKEQAYKLLAQMRAPIEYIRSEPTKTPLKKIPVISRFIKDAATTNNAARQLSTLQGAPPTAVTTGLQFGGVSLAALDFFLVPIGYLHAYISGQKVPISLNSNARWAYAGVGLGLALTATFVPGAAPVIGLVGAALSLGVGSFLLGKTLYDRYQLGKKRREISQNIEEVEKEIQKLAEALAESIKNGEKSNIFEEGALSKIQKNYDTQKDILKNLKEKEVNVNDAIKNLGTTHVVDRSLKVAFAALSVVGAIVAVFFPPVGLGILAAVAIASITYIAAQLIASLILSAKKRFLNKLEPAVVTNDTQEKVLVSKVENSESMIKAPNPVLQEERNITPVLVSTTRARSNSVPQKHSEPVLTLDDTVRSRSHSTPLDKEALKKVEQEKPPRESDSNSAHP